MLLFLKQGSALALSPARVQQTGSQDANALQVLSERSKRQQRRQQLLGVRSQGNVLWRALQEGLLRANYLFTDHTRNALILAVFGFRVSPAPSSALMS